MRAKKIGLEMQKVIIPGLAYRKKPISLKVHLGEIVGIAGVSGNGQTIVGLRNILSGVMLLNNTPISNKDVSARRMLLIRGNTISVLVTPNQK